MQPFDENPSRSEAFLRESIKLASETLIDLEARHKEEIALLNQTIMAKEQSLEGLVWEKNRHIASLNEKHENVRKSQEEEIRQLRQSRSWRITKPLRMTYAFFFQKAR